MKLLHSILSPLRSLLAVWRREFSLVMRDEGVMIFFFGLPLLYPIVYTLIYNPEVVNKIEVTVVDHSPNSATRSFIRTLSAAPSIDVAHYAPSLDEARRLMNEKECYAIIEIPRDFGRNVGSGRQATVPFYCDMSLLLRYRTLLSTLTELQLATGAEFRQETIDNSGIIGQSAIGSAGAVGANSTFLGDTSQGFASFIMPGILVLILQQSMILGITMLAGGRCERRLRNGGIDPLRAPAGIFTTVIGRTLCYITLYIPVVLYVTHVVPLMFNLPNVGNVFDYLVYLFPMLVASAFLGQTLGVFVTERESSMLVIVFTSVVFLFLSGLTWPRYAMSPFWHTLGDLIPATWGLEGFIQIASTGSSVALQSHPYTMLWILAALYLLTALLVQLLYRSTLLRNQKSAVRN